MQSRKDVLEQAVAVLRAIAEREDRERQEMNSRGYGPNGRMVEDDGFWIIREDGGYTWMDDDEGRGTGEKSRYLPRETKTRGYTPQTTVTKPKPPTSPQTKLTADTPQEQQRIERKLGVRVPTGEQVLLAKANDPYHTKYYDPPKQSAADRLERRLGELRELREGVAEQEGIVTKAERDMTIKESQRADYRKQAYRES